MNQPSETHFFRNPRVSCIECLQPMSLLLQSPHMGGGAREKTSRRNMTKRRKENRETRKKKLPAGKKIVSYESYHTSFPFSPTYPITDGYY